MQAAHSETTVSAESSHTEQPTDPEVTLPEALAIITTLHADTLGLDTATVTAARADAVMAHSKVQTTTELLLLLARFHAGVDDPAGSALLARFAVEFAALESTVV